MRFQDYRTLFQVVILISVLLAASPALSVVVSFPRGGERFSELWLLGPSHMAEDYPFNIHKGESYSLFLGVDNHIGYAAYFLVYAKFRNQSQPLPNASRSEPSPLLRVSEFQFFLADDDVWETPVTFKIVSASNLGDSVLVERLSINERVFPIVSSSNWDSENSGFYFQLFFELWLYNATESSFQFNDRFVGIWLNVTE